MKTVSKVLLPMAIAAASTAMSMNAMGADVTASAAVSSMYLWRGQELGNGIPAVSGEIRATQSGFYGYAWGSSGDVDSSELDIGTGYAGAVGDFKYDVQVYTYYYPQATDAGEDTTGELGDSSEVIATVGYGPLSFSAFKPVDILSGDYMYYTAGAASGAFSAKIGFSDDKTDADLDYTHLDLTYAYNDRLSFTFSQLVDQDDAGTVDEDLKFVVGYALPLK